MILVMKRTFATYWVKKSGSVKKKEKKMSRDPRGSLIHNESS